MMKKVMIALAGASMLILTSCSIDPELRDPLSEAPPTSGGAPPVPSISTVYEQLNSMVGGQDNTFALREHSTDIIMGPTRGTDWDDFGTWRRLHLHTWGPDHNQVNNSWNQLNGALFQTTLVAEAGTGLVKAEGQFLRGFFRFLTCDLFGQVQVRPAAAAASVIPNVVQRTAIIDSIIAELEAAIPTLPTFNGSNRAQATKEAAYALLAKAYLNKAVYKANPTTPEGPYTFASADMNKVIQYCDLVAANAAIKLDDYYWDNFKWDNGTMSSENIFVRKNGNDSRAGNGVNLVWQTCMGGHYNQRPSGWNGFTTLSDFYDSFQDGDERKKDTLEGFTSIVGPTVGFLEGRAFGPVNPSNIRQPGVIGNPVGALFDRAGNPLIFTRDVSIFFNGEAEGIRIMKFPLQPSSINDGGWGSPNEFPFLRFADVRLMKAEAILRGGTPTGGETAKSIVNEIQASRKGKVDGTVGLNEILAERGRELYLEGWRRNDLIRFGKYNDPVQERPTKSAGYKVVYPIPLIALSSNPNLKQNFGY
jgi:hypothetical protein